MTKRQIAKRNAVLQRRYEINYFPKVKRAIDGTISSLIAVIKAGGLDAGGKFLSEKIDTGTLPNVIEDLYIKVGLRFARLQQAEFRLQQQKGFGLNEAWIAFIKDYLYKFLLDKITFEVGDYTRKVLLATLQKAYDEGWGVDETVRRLEELPLSRTQAARIVRTETTRASNTGTMAAGSTFEFEQQKEWIAAMDMRTRGTDPEDHANHRKLDGTVIDYDDAFIDPRNGDRLMFPGDPKASAASTINCRCTIAITAKRDANDRLVPKRKGVKEKKEVEIIEKEVDLQPLYDKINEVEAKLSNQIALAVKLNKTTVDLTPVEEKIADVKRSMPLPNDYSSELQAIRDGIKEALEKDNGDVLEKIDGLIEGIKGIRVEPVVEVKTENKEVDMMPVINVLNELRQQLAIKRKYKHKIERDYNDLIKEIITEQII